MYRGFSAFLTLAGVFLGGWLGIRFLLPILLPFLLGLLLALAAEPLAALLSRRGRLPRSISAGISVSLTVTAIAILVGMLLAFAVRELGLLAGILPDVEETARSGFSLVESHLLRLAERTPGSIRPILQRNVTDMFSDGSALLNRGVQYVLSLAGNLLTHVPDSALTLGTAIISAFLFSAKLPKLRAWLLHALPREKLKPLLQTLGRIRSAVGSWLIAQGKLSAVSFGILLAGLLLLRISYAPLWALGICLVDAFPILGTGTVLLPWALILFLQGDSARALGLVGVYITVSTLRSVLEPKLLGRQLGLDPLVTLIALYTGYKLLGILGMILAPLLTVTALQLLPQKRG